ncbi:MAG TPA: cytochrome b N-terminal domain-containing protein [Anaerolineales bacterium]|nr:cytochrome b N-terminal domain-containing protein [Anaerolineales bacterium]
MSVKFGHPSASETGQLPKQQFEGMAEFRRSALLQWVERWALLIERPFNWPGGAALNLFYHTDTLAVFLWLIVGLTGIYLSLFYYQFDFENAYLTVAVKIEGPVVARVVRAVHRYASDSAMIVTVLHGIRLYFMGRFRGARWLAWVAGVIIFLLLWLDGLTGYWLIWDQRAQLITDSFTAFLSRFSDAAPSFVSALLISSKTDRSWIFIAVIFAVHILLFGIAALFFWWHIMRLNRPHYLPPSYWMIGVSVVVVIVSALFPLGMLPIADFGQRPGAIPLDPFYFFYLPFSFGQNAARLWIALAVIFVVLNLIPWLLLKRTPAPIRIDDEKCGGCKVCADDCPYKAITMNPRAASQPNKLIAEVNPHLCVTCGVCLGSCDRGAIAMGKLTDAAISQSIETRLAHHKDKRVTLCFTCERHAAQGARPYLNGRSSDHREIEVIPLPCVASLPPALVARAMSSGAGEVRVVGCPPDDCSRREGNQWTDGRLGRTRLPRLKKTYENAPIYTFWLPPDAFAQALPVLSDEVKLEEKMESNRPGASYSPVLTRRNFALAFGLLAILMAVQVVSTQIWSPQIYPMSQASVQLVIPDSRALIHPAERFAQKHRELLTRLVLRDGGEILFDQPYPFPSEEGEDPLVVEFPAAVGGHNLTLSLISDSGNPSTLVLYDQTVTLTPGQVWIIMYDDIPPRHK